MTASPQESTFDGLLRWRCIGPFRGGRVVAVAGSYHDPQTFYFGGAPAASGKRPTPAPTGSASPMASSPPPSVGALAVAPSDSNVIYAGTGETTIRIDVSHGDGVYKSTDAGRTWTHVGLRDTRHIGKIRVHPHRSRHGLGGGARPRLRPATRSAASSRRTDGGATWRQGAVRQRQGRRGRPHRRSDQPAHPLRRRLGGVPQLLATQQRRRGQRPLAEPRRRRDLGEHLRPTTGCRRARSARSASPPRRRSPAASGR